MLNLVSKKRVLTLIPVIGLLVFGMHNVVYCQNNSVEANSSASYPLSASEIRRNILPAVVFITTNSGNGSGVVVRASDPSHEGVFVLTNEHVTHGNDKVMVYFLAYNLEGEEIQEREFYLAAKNRVLLERLGYIASGRVVAENKETDVAIIRLHGLPKTVKTLPLNDVEVYAHMAMGEAIHILGHPGDKEFLWQWDPGHFRGYDEKSLSLDARAWFGNSGGPVINESGVLIGLTRSIDEKTKTYAVSLAPIIALEEALKGWRIFSITNETDATVHYEIKWSESGTWQPWQLDPHKSKPYIEPMYQMPEGYPKIRYISTEQATETSVSTDTSQQTEPEGDKELKKDTHIEHMLRTKFQFFGLDAKDRIKPELDAYNYRFLSNPQSKNIELHEPRRTVWLANHTKSGWSYTIKWAGGGLSEKSYTLEPGKSRPHWNAETSTGLSTNYPKILIRYRWTNPDDGTKFSGYLEKSNLTTEIQFFSIMDAEEDKHTTDLVNLITNKPIEAGTHYYHLRVVPKRGSLEIRDGLPSLEEVLDKPSNGWKDWITRVFGYTKVWVIEIRVDWTDWIILIIIGIVLGFVGFNAIFPKTAVFSIKNDTEESIEYQIKWTTDEDWDVAEPLEPDAHSIEWYDQSPNELLQDYPKVRFDSIINDKKETKEHTLEFYIRRSLLKRGKGISQDGTRQYHFELDSETKTLNLVDSEESDE